MDSNSSRKQYTEAFRIYRTLVKSMEPEQRRLQASLADDLIDIKFGRVGRRAIKSWYERNRTDYPVDWLILSCKLLRAKKMPVFMERAA